MPLITNIHPAAELRALARRKRQRFHSRSVPLPEVAAALDDGWELHKQRARTATIIKPKRLDVWLEDRVWSLLYRMGFHELSGEGGAVLRLSAKDDAPSNQLDVVALDDEVALAIECKTSATPGRRLMQGDLAKQGQIREAFARAAGSLAPKPTKRYTVLAFFTENVLLGLADRRRAAEHEQLLFDEADLAYYESLTAHVGAAARYQFLADLLPGKRVPALSLRVPALRARMGGFSCYTFAVSPEYLLKVAYVSHRAKGKASDVNTYQRMIQKSRLKKISDYIANDGMFPTNIVISLERSKRTHFDVARQEGDEVSGAELGWLSLNPAYKSAWVIDGQHRLYAYSGHPRARRSVVSVLAFDGLPASLQAKLFIDINAEQKSVKQTLLQELYAELHWDADDDDIRARAIISKAIQVLGGRPDSPLYQRILMADSARTAARCVSLASLFGGLDRTGMYFEVVKRGAVLQYGPLWAGDNTATLERTVAVIAAWFRWIADRSNGWWDLGAAAGGGLAMNDGIAICLDVLRSVCSHLQEGGLRLVALDTDELIDALQPYGEALGDHLGSLSEDLRKSFRDLRGNQGKATGLRRCQIGIAQRIAEFQPTGLSEWIELDKAKTNESATSSILRIEKMLQDTVLGEIKQEFGPAEAQWFFRGVPKAVRKQVDDRINEDQGQRGGREENLDLIHYREIALANWSIFQDLLGYGKGGKERRTQWIVDVNEVRKTAMHASRGARAPVTYEQLARLTDYERWLKRAGHDPEGATDTSDELGDSADLEPEVASTDEAVPGSTGQ